VHLKSVAALAWIGLQPLRPGQCLAQSITDYKALVCVFSFGGNDGNNLVSRRYGRVQQLFHARGGPTTGLAIPQAICCL